MKQLVAFLLLLCTSPALADGPLFSIWHIDGHGYAWQQAQIDAGYPVEPSVRMIAPPDRNGTPTALNTNAPLLSKMDGKSFALRMNNITGEIDRTIPRVVPTEANYATSHNCVRRLADGTLDTTPNMCPLAGTTAWAEVGRQWGTSVWMKRLQEIIPNPTGIILRENNEGPRLKFTDLYVRVGVKTRNSNGVLVFADSSTPPSKYDDPPPSTPGIQYRLEPGGGATNALQPFAYYWKSAAELDGIDIRLAPWVAGRIGSFPPDSLPVWTALENAQYRALYAAMEANSAPGWRGKWRFCGYSTIDKNRQNDAASPPMYLGFFRDPDLTVPGAYAVNRWDAGSEELAAEQANPKAWREYSLSVTQIASAIYVGKQRGRHEIVDPVSFAGLISHLAWRMQSPGREVRFTYWENAFTVPSQLVFAKDKGTVPEAAHVNALTALGRPDLLTLTVEDYERAVMQSLARIHSNPVLSEYWRRGATRLMTSPLNTATATKVYATETTIPGVTAQLVCVYTPCDLPGVIQVEGLLLPAKRLGYYLTNPILEIE